MAGDEESCCGSGVGGGSGRTKPNILVTGTPGTGKTTTSSLLADATQLRYINVGDLIKNNNLHDGWDEEFECHIINEELMSILDKKKVIWDEEMLETCIRLCVKEVMKGNRPTTHLNKEGCVNVIAKFKNLTQKDLGNKQLKVKWDNLKKDWKLWKKLIGKETSLGWNSEKKTIEASDDWWIAKLKEVPAAIKFREKGLFMPYELEILFGNVIASREHAWTSASRSLPLRDIPVTNIEGYGDSDDILNQTP